MVCPFCSYHNLLFGKVSVGVTVVVKDSVEYEDSTKKSLTSFIAPSISATLGGSARSSAKLGRMIKTFLLPCVATLFHFLMSSERPGPGLTPASAPIKR